MTSSLARAALLALLATASWACSAQLPDRLAPAAPDLPAQATSTVGPGLLMTAAIDHSLLAPAGRVSLKVELKNPGASPAAIAPDGPCSPALVLTLLSLSGQVVWSEPVPMCAVVGPPAAQVLQPGQSVTATRCFSLDLRDAACTRLDVPAATYLVSGTFHALTVPQLQLRVAAHPSASGAGAAPGAVTTTGRGAPTSGAGQRPATPA